MQPQDFLDELSKEDQAKKDQADKQAQIDAVNGNGERVAGALKEHTNELTGSIHQLLMATLVSKDPKIAETAKNLAALLGEIKNATDGIKGANFKPLGDSLSSLQETLSTVPDQIAKAHAATDPTPLLKEIASTLGEKDFNPKVNVAAPKIDLSSLTSILTDIKTEVSKEGDKVDTSKLESLTSDVSSAVKSVTEAINNQQFPIPNYVLPFKDVNGKATQVQLDSSGDIPVTIVAGSFGWNNYFANAITTTVIVSNVAGKFGGHALINLNSSPAYLQCFDTTGAVTLGTTPPTFVIPLPANSTAANGVAANFELTNGATLVNGLKLAATTTASGASTVSTGLSGSIWYH